MRIAPNVWGLGATSLLTDASAEMVMSVLPAYLILSGGLAPMALGVATGLHAGGPIVALWLGGMVADRSGRRKLTAAAGYAISAVCRLGWWALAPARAPSWLALFIVSDRIGKAIRTAPRDAIISLSTPPSQLATAFGVHRALDAAGAAAGPLIAWLVLWQLPRRYDVVFFVSFVLALVGLAALAFQVRETVAAEVDDSRLVPTRERVALGGLGGAAFGRVLWLALIFGLVTIGDAFLYLIVVERSQAGAHMIPLFYTGTALSFLILAVPIGYVADVVGRRRLFILGHGALLLAYGVAAGPVISWPWSAFACVLLLGAYYAASDGVLAGVAGALLPSAAQATGLAWVATAVGVGRMCSAFLFGLLWTRYGDRLAVIVFAAALAGVIAAFLYHGRAPDQREALAP